MINMMLKVNLHICEHCNYSCRHCFAKFKCARALGAGMWHIIIDNILSSGAVNEINIAGGEPLLHPQMTSIVDYICERNIPVSLVTNGSLMTEVWIEENGKKFKTVGFSIDSLNPELQRNIGRCSADGSIVSAADFEHKIKLLRQVNPDIKIKINTVVSSINMHDNIAGIIKNWQVDRWKILKMQVFDDGTHCNRGIAVSDEDYDDYFKRAVSIFGIEPDGENILYQSGRTEIVAERVLKGGYIMVDANGILVDNTKNASYVKICDCQTDSFTDGLKRLMFDKSLYAARY